MKRVVTAVNHNVLNEYFRKNHPDFLIERNDISSQEELLNVIKEDIPDVLVLSDELPGKYDKRMLVEKIRKIDKFFKIVIIVGSIDQDYRNFLNGKGIFDILVNEDAQISDLIEVVENQGRVIVKVEKEIPNEIKKEIQTLKKLLSEKPKVIEKHILFEKPAVTQRQEIIVVAGAGGTGKTTLLVQFAALLAKISQTKILCIDLNTEFPNLECFFGVSRQPEGMDYFIGSGKDSSLNYMIDSIDKDRFDSNSFEGMIVKYNNLPNLDILTGNKSLFDCQNTLNAGYYKSILQKAKELYDFIFIDTSSNIFLDSTQFAAENATKIYFVIEPNIACIKKSTSILDIFLNIWGINKKKIQIVINKKGKHSLEKEIIKELMTGFNICKYVDYNDKHEYCLNHGVPFVIKATEKEKEIYRKIVEELNFVGKRSIFDRLFSKRLKKVEERLIEHKEDIKC
ncbi:MAG: AAA family ATPase [Ignavibacteriales bacterium]